MTGPHSPDPRQTQITLPPDIEWTTPDGVPPQSYELAAMLGDPDGTGPYCSFVRWHPGYMSGPHMYATDRICAVIAGIWWVNSGIDFDPGHCVPVSAGSFVRRVAMTPHYDGVIASAREPATIAIFGIAPVLAKLVDPAKPLVRKL